MNRDLLQALAFAGLFFNLAVLAAWLKVPSRIALAVRSSIGPRRRLALALREVEMVRAEHARDLAAFREALDRSGNERAKLVAEAARLRASLDALTGVRSEDPEGFDAAQSFRRERVLLGAARAYLAALDDMAEGGSLGRLDAAEAELRKAAGSKP